MKVDCKAVAKHLPAYVDGEAGTVNLASIASHLAACPQCEQAAEAQKAMKTLVQAQPRNVSAPANLNARIRSDLRGFATAMGFSALVRRLFVFHPRYALASVAVLFVSAGLLTYFGGSALAVFSDSMEFSSNGRLVGELVCADCQFLMITNTLGSHDETHRLVLKCEGNKLWNIVQTPKGRELLELAKFSPRLVEADGYLFPRVGYIQVTDFKMRPH